MTSFNPYQDVINWLQSDEGSSWSEQRMLQAYLVAWELGGDQWNLNSGDSDTVDSPIYLAGVLSIKEDNFEDG